MKWIVAMLLGIGLFATGCSTTKYAGPVVTPAFVQQLRSEPHAQDIEVEVAPLGESKEAVRPIGKLADFYDNTITLRFALTEPVPPGWQEMMVFPVASVRRIRATNHLNGAFLGAAVGVLAAVAAGVAVYATTSDCAGKSYNEVDGFCFSPAFKGTFVTFLLGTPATLLGAYIGSRVGTSTDYEFGQRLAR